MKRDDCEIILLAHAPTGTLPLLQERAHTVHVPDVEALLQHLETGRNPHLPRRMVILLADSDGERVCGTLRELKAHERFGGLPVAVVCTAEPEVVRRLYELRASCVVVRESLPAASAVDAISSFWLDTPELPTCD